MNSLICSLLNFDQIRYRMFLPLESITLTDDQVAEAIAFSQLACSKAEQWQVYLSLLALFGTKQWLQRRAPELRVTSDWLKPSQPDRTTHRQVQPLNQLVSQLRVEAFTFYLLTTDDLDNRVVPIPRSISCTEHTPHFYLLTEVLEEFAEVRVCGYLPHHQLAVSIPSLVTEEEKNYLVPHHQFNGDPGKLLRYLRHLKLSVFMMAKSI